MGKFAAVTAAVMVAALATAVVEHRAAPTTAAASESTSSGWVRTVVGDDEPTRYRFLSAPDFMNGDVADLRRYRGWARARRGAPGRRPPNSWNASYARMLDLVMDRFRAEDPDDVLVAGDLVNGHWGTDHARAGIFGPVRTRADKLRAVSRAAEFYFTAYARLFRSRGLDLRPAMGDHEYGDDPWRGTARGAAVKRAAMGIVQRHFHRAFHERYGYTARPPGPASRTAYAVQLHPEVLLVTLDEFEREPTDVVGQVDDAQLAWLDEVLADANERGTDWIIVQGHLPIVPNVRSVGSSQLCYAGGRASPLWRTLVDHEVDLYLNGEVHDNTAHHVDGVTQVTHGGILGMGLETSRGNTSYLVGDVVGDRLDLRLMRFVTRTADRSRRLWQTARAGAPVRSKVLEPVPDLLGTMTLTADQELLERSGDLGPYDGPAGCRTGGEPLDPLALLGAPGP